MDSFKAYRYYMALKLHFSNPKFDVFENKGRVKGSIQKFEMRNDRLLFDKLSRKFPQDKELVQYIASNFMYDNPNVVYDPEEGMANYKEFLRRKQSITRVFENDLDIIINAQQISVDNNIPFIIQLLISNKITIETVVIINQFDNFLDDIKSDHVKLMFESLLLRVMKSTKFVKFDSNKLRPHYYNFKKELKGNKDG